ncbi:hypothetical protein QYE76_013801 [Lolium multiflorum]|uniref:Uncharacterized protein n=1 Tax=Lolium multiflorum TaxID=4521 RepID=A0AAD8U3L3_LOLMU|nr:hypothetical protein QYE76_013801 [Lolium multiflorum]
MLAMTGHAKKLSDLGIVIPNRLGINRVLQSLPPSYKNFVMNYNMQNMNKELPELFAMLKSAEIEMKEHQVLMVNKTTSFKKQGKSKGRNKKGGKKAASVKPKTGPKLMLSAITARRRDTGSSSAVPEDVLVPPAPATEEANDNDHETSNEIATEPRRSTRERATPDWYDPCLNVMIVDNNDEDPATYEEAMMSPDSNKWQEAMKSKWDPLSWASSKQCTVAKSSTESEYIAASEASSEAIWMKRFIVELGVVPSALDPLVIYCDNMGAIANAQEPRSHKRLKHIKLRYHSIREYIEDGEMICHGMSKEYLSGDEVEQDMASSINFNQFLEKEKLKSNGSNFTDWFRHVRIFLAGGNLQYVLDAPLGDPPAETETDEVKNVYETRKTRYSQVQCAILCSLEADLQKRFEHHDPHELVNELKAIFETHAAWNAMKHRNTSCMMEEGSSVSEHMLAMTGHAKKLSDLGIVIPNRLGINRVLQSLPPSYKNFVMNYNMQNMNKELPELFAMLKSSEIEIKKEHQVLMVNKTTSFKKQGKSKGRNKKGGKKAATPPVKPKWP